MASTTKIYRIEDKLEKVGIYNSVRGKKLVLDSSLDLTCKRRPNPTSKFYELSHEKRENCIFGFKTKKQLLRWFPKKDFKKLLGEDIFVLCEILIEKKFILYEDDAQISFLKTKIIEKTFRDLKSFYDTI